MRTRDLDLVNRDELERNLRRNLQPSRIEGSDGLAEEGIGYVAINSVQVHPIQHIEELKAQLQIHSFRESGIFDDRGVDREKAWSSEAIGLLVAFRPQRRHRKIR